MSPDLTEIINKAEQAVGIAPEVKPATEVEVAVNGEADGESEDDEEADEGAAAGTEKKKKKKKPKKKKKAAGPGGNLVQSDPPRVPLSSFFKPDAYPSGEVCDYVNDNAWRTTSEEKRHQERLEQAALPLDSPYNYNAIRKASEVHRQVRQYARKNIRVGMTMTEIAEMIENATRALVGEDGLKAGIGFPTGVNRNHIAAHFSPNAGDKTVLEYEDVVKIDFGVQVNGRIVDSAFTMSFDHTYDQLIAAVNDATNTGVREAGIDARMGDIGAAIQEAMESYEVVIGTKTLPVKSIRNLTGHSITPYSIHGGDNGKSVPIVAQHGPEGDVKMEEGEYFAIETFGSTGRGYVRSEGVCSHYARDTSVPMQPLKLQSAKKLMGTIDREFGTLPWCRRYLDRLGESGYLLGLRELVDKGIIRDYPPLVDEEGSQTAQLEHTILLRPTCKEVVSRGDDY